MILDSIQKYLSVQHCLKLQLRSIEISSIVDPLFHKFQPPCPRLQRLRQLPHLLLLRKRLQADPPQVCEGAPLTKIFHGLNGRS